MSENILQQELPNVGMERKGMTSTATDFLFSYSFAVFFYFCAIPIFSHIHTQWFASQKRIKEKGSERRPHSNTFICAMLTRLNSPSESLMRKNGLAEEPTRCIHSCHHHLNPRLLNPQLCPPAWMGNDLSVSI